MSGPSSSNGDAAAALTAMWGNLNIADEPPTPASAAWSGSGTPGRPASVGTPEPVPQADAAAVAAALAAAAACNPPEGIAAARPRAATEGGGGGGNWRVKFLQKVGVADQREPAGPPVVAEESIFNDLPWTPTLVAAKAAAGAAAAGEEADSDDVVVVKPSTQASA